VKLEGIDGHEDVIQHIVGSGVPVMGHLGLTPQSVHQLGGFKVQGRSGVDAARLVRQAHGLQELGCFAVVLECVPPDLASRITAELTIPTIGIGAGSGTDGQVLVLQDLLGLGAGHVPRFVRSYADGAEWMMAALNHFDADVKGGEFPRLEESYTG
jgi:3-methyl-2-oxobutanoate hydroxymethyltransferase